MKKAIMKSWLHTSAKFFLAPLSCLAIGCLQANASTTADAVSFGEQVRPILSNNCFHCHGPDAEDRQADVRLDMPGEVDLDTLVERISESDPDLVMPPPDSHKKLSPEQIAILKQWVAAGAQYQQHWSFEPPKLQAAAQVDPPTGFEHWAERPTDRYVLARMQRSDLTPTEQATRRTLIRRLTLDLTGLPPTREQVRAFVEDKSEDAYEQLVERLLASPQYGEHMARYWLDLVRFADTNGLHHDHYREMTPYRDWVIRSFNENLPLDEFIKYQLAGDLYEEPTKEQLIASGFNRLHLIIDVGTALPEESFNRNVVDRVSAFGTAFLGLTVQCAVCHDHKYDPITQRDFYQLYAFFNNFDGQPETGRRNTPIFKRGLQEPYLELPTPEQEEHLKLLQQQYMKVQRLRRDLGFTKARTPEHRKLDKQLKDLSNQTKQLRSEFPATLIMKERKEIRPAHILIRGEYDQPGELVERNTPSFLPPLDVGDNGPVVGDDRVPTRMDLAEWLVQPDHPLTARVAVNRFWQQLFGTGLVKTSEDFGAQGEVPSHPKLLDFLTVQFVESGWDVKQLMRTMVLSQTYRQSSRSTPQQYREDPNNRRLARGSRYRLDAEVIRDQQLALSGLLNLDMYGRSVKPPQPAGLWKIVAMPSSYPNKFTPDHGEKIYRRSVYSFWKRGLPPPQLTIFDAPSRESCIARRERTNTPLQALLLMNEQQSFEAARSLAEELRAREGLTDRQRIAAVYEQVTSQVADEQLLKRLEEAWEKFRQLYARDTQAAAKLIDADTASTEDLQPQVADLQAEDLQAERAAWTMLVHSLLNLDAVKTRE